MGSRPAARRRGGDGGGTPIGLRQATNGGGDGGGRERWQQLGFSLAAPSPFPPFI